jgi:hypothetical protein
MDNKKKLHSIPEGTPFFYVMIHKLYKEQLSLGFKMEHRTIGPSSKVALNTYFILGFFVGDFKKL